MFKKDEYIVLINKSFNSRSFPLNFVFKQKKTALSIDVYLDAEEDLNGLSLIEFSKSQDWRYATQEEIEEYEILGKPYDVTTLDQFVLPERWYVVVTEENIKDVYEWRRGEPYDSVDNPSRYLAIGEIAGMCNPNGKGHNPKTSIKSDNFDFGIEITYNQFIKYVLKRTEVEINYSYLIPMIEKLND